MFLFVYRQTFKLCTKKRARCYVGYANGGCSPAYVIHTSVIGMINGRDRYLAQKNSVYRLLFGHIVYYLSKRLCNNPVSVFA